MSTTDNDNVIQFRGKDADDSALICDTCGYAVFNLLASGKIECAICREHVNGVWRHHNLDEGE